MYLITASLLNSWNYLLKSGNTEEFKRVLERVPTPSNEAIETGFAFEKWCENHFPETKGGMFQVTAKKAVGEYLLYGRMDCIKAGTIYDYKYTKRYDVGKFYNSIQTAMYFELVPEAKRMSYIISNTKKFHLDAIYREDYTREETASIFVIIEQFMKWIKDNGCSMEKWLVK